MLSKDPYRVSMSFNLSLQYLAGWKPVKFSLTEPFFYALCGWFKTDFPYLLTWFNSGSTSSTPEILLCHNNSSPEIEEIYHYDALILTFTGTKAQFFNSTSVSISLGTKIIKRDAMNLKIFINYDHIGFVFYHKLFHI